MNPDNTKTMRVMAQVVAVTVKSLVLVLIGMNLAYVAILIPSLTDPNSEEIIYLNEEQTSWTGSILSIMAPIGSTFSGVIAEALGRKRALIFLTVPYLVSWICFYFSKELWHIIATLALQGIIKGLTEASVWTYVAEVTEPKLRGPLSSFTLFSGNVGVLIQFILGSMLHWRTVALVTCSVPLVTLGLLLNMPETPYWLLSRNKPDEARKSLAWLRGWTTDENVEQEFQEIQKSFTGIDNFIENGRSSSYTEPTGIQRLKKYCKMDFLGRFCLISVIMVWSNSIGIAVTQTYSVVIFSTFNVPINEYYATVIMSLSCTLGAILCIFLVRYYGKRKTALASSFLLFVCYVCIGIYAYKNDIIRLNFEKSSSATDGQEQVSKWIPIILLVSFGVISHCGPKNLPWTLISEVFSNDTRSAGCGLVSSVHYVSTFIASMVYLKLIVFMSFPGLYWKYACICLIGVINIYFFVPETDGKTLEQISDYYSRSNKDMSSKSGECSNKVNLS